MYFDHVEFGKRLKALRLSKGMTLEELAEALNISLIHMRKMEKGLKGCSLDLLLDLAVYFGVTTDYLLTGKEPDRTAERIKLRNVIAELSDLAEIL